MNTKPVTSGAVPPELEQLLTPTIMLVMVNDAGAILEVRRAEPTFLLAQLAAQQQATQHTKGDLSCNNKHEPAAGRFPWLSG